MSLQLTGGGKEANESSFESVRNITIFSSILVMLSLKLLYNTPLGNFFSATRSKTMSEKEDQVIPAEKYPFLDSDPVKAAYVRSIPKSQFYRNVLLQGYFVPPSILQGLADFEVRPDDVFIITYPKSGTTWTEEIVSLIFNDGDTKKVQNKLLIYRVHHLEVGRPIGHFRYLQKLKSPRFMATHLPLNCIPRQLQQAHCKIIYVVRNPKDNAVSYYHHHRMSTFLGNYKGPWSDFLSHFLKGHLVYGSWFDHVLTYWKFHLEHPDKVLFISYEELKMDLEKMIERIAIFLSHPLAAETIKTIANHCSFDQMKNNNMVNREQLPITDFFDMTQSKFMRKGIIGDWKNYFTDEQNKLFDRVYKEKMVGSGLDLVFEPNEAFKRIKTYGRIILSSKTNTNRENCIRSISVISEEEKHDEKRDLWMPSRTDVTDNRSVCIASFHWKEIKKVAVDVASTADDFKREINKTSSESNRKNQDSTLIRSVDQNNEEFCNFNNDRDVINPNFGD
ncbi:sulfotransferase 1B1-like isoform X2 [Tachypleus tridentatus]|uniref:sulfotransferase 1B1-like isoform X2 n=1 Tax=Tachypleus tridentatus TaxID=6853 RepID=UPI003FD4A861